MLIYVNFLLKVLRFAISINVLRISSVWLLKVAVSVHGLKMPPSFGARLPCTASGVSEGGVMSASNVSAVLV